MKSCSLSSCLWIFGKERLILFMARNSCTNKAEWAGAGHKFGSILTHAYTVFQHALCTDLLEVPNMLTSQIVNLLFLGQIPILYLTFDPCCLLRGVPSIGHHQQRSHYLWTWKTTQKLVFFSLSAIQNHFQHFGSPHSIFFPVGNKIWSLHSVLSSLPFSRCAKIANGTTSTWENILLINLACHNLIPSMKWLGRLCCISICV